MTLLLEHLSIPVVGYSLPAEKDSLFESTSRKGAIPENFYDIRDYESLERFIDLHRPSTIIHMAAQSQVLESYRNPRETFDINVMGTVNLLDISSRKDFVKAIIVVTTDKVYRNDNTGNAYVETDPLEGKDPYSASKVGVESVVSAWQQIVRVSSGPSIISVRAGNVVGGGDLASQRLVPDIIRAASSGRELIIRNPSSTRPWLFVLDPLTGYLLALEKSLEQKGLTSFNFGPKEKNLSVLEISQISQTFFPEMKIIFTDNLETNDKESSRLDLNSDMSQTYLKWNQVIAQAEALRMTFSWWSNKISKGSDVRELCQDNIKTYFEKITRINDVNPPDTK
jgi:CDP-glucose 4,6-dehydratase